MPTFVRADLALSRSPPGTLSTLAEAGSTHTLSLQHTPRISLDTCTLPHTHNTSTTTHSHA